MSALRTATALCLALALSACDAPCEAHEADEGTSEGTGETGADELPTGELDADNPLACDWPGDVALAVPQSNGLCSDCLCGIHGVFVECGPLYPCP